MNNTTLSTILRVVCLALIASIAVNVSAYETKQCSIDLREKLWRYDLNYALEVALSYSELQKIKNVSDQLKDDDFSQSVWNVLEWVDNNIQYDYEKRNLTNPEFEYIYSNGELIDIKVVSGVNNTYQTPYETIKKGKGVCRDYAILTAGLLLAMNYSPCYIFDINFENTNEGHLAAGVKINDSYFILDQHLPVYDLGRYYSSWMDDGRTIKNYTIYEVSKTSSFAKVKKVKLMNGEEFKKNAYKIDQDDLKRISNDLLNLFAHSCNLTPDRDLKDFDKWRYRNQYEFAKKWTMMYDQSFYHEVFHKSFISYVFRDITEDEEHRDMMDDINKSDRLWIESDLQDKYICIHLYLAKFKQTASVHKP